MVDAGRETGGGDQCVYVYVSEPSFNPLVSTVTIRFDLKLDLNSIYTKIMLQLTISSESERKESLFSTIQTFDLCHRLTSLLASHFSALAYCHGTTSTSGMHVVT